MSHTQQAVMAIERDKNIFSFISNVDMDLDANFSTPEAQANAKSFMAAVEAEISLTNLSTEDAVESLSKKPYSEIEASIKDAALTHVYRINFPEEVKQQQLQLAEVAFGKPSRSEGYIGNLPANVNMDDPDVISAIQRKYAVPRDKQAATTEGHKAAKAEAAAIAKDVQVAQLKRSMAEDIAKAEAKDEALKGGIKSDTLSHPLGKIDPVAFRGSEATAPSSFSKSGFAEGVDPSPYGGKTGVGNGGDGGDGTGTGPGPTGSTTGQASAATGHPSSPAPGSPGGSCFIAGTQVIMHDHTLKNIEDVQVSDRLHRFDGESNEVLKLQTVNMITGGRKLGSINGGDYFFTEDHPLKTPDGWKSINTEMSNNKYDFAEICQLAIGDIIIGPNGDDTIIESIDTKDVPDDTPIYNFELDGDHEYFANGFLVHNKIICTELNDQGLIPTDVWKADIRGSKVFPQFILDGYHLWAKPVVKRMRKSKSFSRKVQWAASPVFYQIAAFGGCGKWSVTGLSMLAVGLPICAILGAAMLPFKQKNTNLILGDT